MTYTQASKQKKPILILFTIKGCTACREFEPIIEVFRSRYATKYNYVKEDVSGNVSKIAQKLNVNAAPSLFILEPNKNRAREINFDCMFDSYCLDKELRNYK